MSVDKSLSEVKNKIKITEEYALSPREFFDEKKLPAIGGCLLSSIENNMSLLEEKLLSSSSVINAISSVIPKETYQVVFNEEQKQQLASGVIKLLTKKDGTLIAQFRNSATGRIASNIEIEKVQVTPECSQAMTNLAMQMQLAQIAEQIQIIQKSVEEIQVGQENDRLAIAYSCQQRLIQAFNVKNQMIRTSILLDVISDAENSRTQLMMSQKNNISQLLSQPQNMLMKALSANNTVSRNDEKLSEIRNSLCVVNMVSLVEAIAYQELGETDAAKISLKHYENYLVETYLSDPMIIERLNSLDPSTTGYWKKIVPKIRDSVAALPEHNESLCICGE